MTPAAEIRKAQDRLSRAAGAAGAAVAQHKMVTITGECALAVAEWLDRFADPVYCYGPVEYDAALNIARAFLGTEGGG